MSTVTLRLYDNPQSNSSLPEQDYIKLNEFNIQTIPEDFVISRDKNGNIISRYKDDTWDFTPYRSNPAEYSKLNFNSRINNKENIKIAKRLIMLLLLFGSGNKNSKYSVGTICDYFKNAIVPLSDYSISNDISITYLLESNDHLIALIKTKKNRKRSKVITMTSLLSFLDSMDNTISLINFKRDKKVFNVLQDIRKSPDVQTTQTILIPSRILNESLKQRWKQISYIEKHMNGILSFLNDYINTDRFAANTHKVRLSKNKHPKDTTDWEMAVDKYDLNNLFQTYNIKSRINFRGFLAKIQGTCKHLIHAYTGMRNGEVLNMQTNCLSTVDSSGNICHIISTTSKLEGTNITTKWVTSKEIIRVIDLLSKINNIIAKQYNLDIKDIPLFVTSELFVDKNKIVSINNFHRGSFGQGVELALDTSKLIFTQDDKNELDEISFNSNIQEMEVGKPWIFRSHQYRRSLVVYSIQSGLVSLGALQIQLKHLFQEMTTYYGNGASYAKKLFDMPKEHIAHDINILKPEIEALVYIKEVIFSEEQLFGAHGTFVERNIKVDKKNQAVYLLENREKTAKQFKNGEIAYKATAVGGCISLEACDYALTRSIIACPGCDSGIIKKSKLDNVIDEQKEFIKLLDKDSIEYRTEVRDLEELEKQRKIFLGSKA